MSRWILLFVVSIQCFALKASAETVVCLHGFMTTYRSMFTIKKALTGGGFTVYNWDYPSRQCTIEQHACNLVPVLQQLAAHNPGEPIDFIAHSTGSLILRAALNLPGCPEEAKTGRAVLLAPPNQGSELGNRYRNFAPIRFAMGSKTGRELMCYDACDVHNLGTFPDSMEVLVIAGTNGNCLLFNKPNDGYITVSETALDTPYYWKCFPVTHSGLLTNPTVLCYMKRFLQNSSEEEK